MVYKDVDGHWASRFWDYLGVNEPDERLAGSLLWQHLGPVYLICLLIFALWILSRPLPGNYRGNLFPNAYGILWLVLVFPAWVFVISVFILIISLRGGHAEAEGVIGSHDISPIA